MSDKSKNKSVCFRMHPVIHNYLSEKAKQGKKIHGQYFGMGEVITEFCLADNPELVKHLVNPEKPL